MGFAALLVWLILAAMAAGSASAAPASVERSRLVKRFDFEATDAGGQKIGRGHQLPRHWYVIGREAGTNDVTFHRQPLHQWLIQAKGFPRFTEVGFSSRHASSGEFSFHLGLNSGNAGAFLEVGALPAVPGSDYLVTARVRTEKLNRAAAQLIVYFVNQDGERVAESVRRSRRIQSNDKWTTVSLRLGGPRPSRRRALSNAGASPPGRPRARRGVRGFGEAAWVGLELRLMQPEASKKSPLKNQQIVLSDVTGHAWFDDISFWQLPRVQISTQSPVNILRGGDKPRIEARVRDVTGRRLTAEARVFDHQLNQVARTTRQVGAGTAGVWQWRPNLPGFGWYLTELTVRDRSGGGSSRAIARTMGAFLWLPKTGPLPGGDANRFGLVAEGMSRARQALLPDLLRRSRLPNVVLSAWRKSDRAATLPARQQQLSEALKPLISPGRRISMALTPVPKPLARAAGEETNHTLRVLANDPQQWLPFVRPPLYWHGQYVKRWQLGASGDARPFFFPQLESTLKRIADRLRSLVPGPRIVLPWSLHQPPRPSLPASVIYAIDVPPAVTPRHLDQYLKPWKAGDHAYRLNLREPSADALSHEARVRDLVLRMLYGWEADQPAMTLDTPWARAFERRPALLPDPLLGAFTMTGRRLAGRNVVGRLPLGEGLKAMIFDGPRGGMLAVWNQSAPPETATLDMYLGQAPVAIDLWGNRRKLPIKDGKHQLTITKTPTFITGIDANLALFRAGFRLDTPFIESLQKPHQRQLRLTNPWPRQITGTLRITGPEGWSVRPGRQSFTIPAGETRALPVTMSFPLTAVAGGKSLPATVRLTADRRYDIDTHASMQLGLKNVKFDATLSLDTQPDGREDAIVNCVITNQGDQRMALYVFANLPGFPRKERLIAQLGPGQSVVRRFQFEAAGAAARRLPVRAGVRQTNGPAILNRRLRLNAAP